jgi:hypothetical protein
MKNWHTAIENVNDEKRLERAKEIQEALLMFSYLIPKVWQGGYCIRVYVQRKLGKTPKDIGYIEVKTDGSAVHNLLREPATICNEIGLIRK